VSDAESPGMASAQALEADPVTGPDAALGQAAAWHAVLLRMAGAVPDDLISEARGWLAEGQPVDVAQALAFAAVAAGVPVRAQDAALISAELLAAGEDTAVFHQLTTLDKDVLEPEQWSFSPVLIDADAELALMAPMLDLTIDPEAFAALDEIDRGAAAIAPGESGVSAVWRAWRAPADGSARPQPRRVFIVATMPGLSGDELPGLTARLQEELIALGESDPQVEVCPNNEPIPGYQSAACAHSALLWAREEPRPIRIARVFDGVDPVTGPMFDPDHPLIEDPVEVDRLAGYLEAALPVLTTSSLMADILDPERPHVVPLTFRTDGEWIWTDTVSYYLRNHSLAPDKELLAHIQATGSGTQFPMISEVALHRVMSFLQRPDDTEPVWVVPETGAAESRPAPV
jgi:hypothetical protein